MSVGYRSDGKGRSARNSTHMIRSFIHMRLCPSLVVFRGYVLSAG